MAEVNGRGVLIDLPPHAQPDTRGVSAVYCGMIFPVMVATLGGTLSSLPSNGMASSLGTPVVMPGVRQGVLASGVAGLVDLTDWVWKMRFPPWCGMAPPVVRRLSVWLTPRSNDASGRAVRLSIDWGDQTTTDDCHSEQTYAHTYAAMGRYTLTVSAINALGDRAALARDVVVVDYPESEDAWRWGQSPGSCPSEQEV